MSNEILLGRLIKLLSESYGCGCVYFMMWVVFDFSFVSLWVCLIVFLRNLILLISLCFMVWLVVYIWFVVILLLLYFEINEICFLFLLLIFGLFCKLGWFVMIVDLNCLNDLLICVCIILCCLFERFCVIFNICLFGWLWMEFFVILYFVINFVML